MFISNSSRCRNQSFQFFVHFTVYQEYSTKYWSNYSNFSLDINFTFLSFYQQLETNNFFLNLVLFLVDIPIPRLDRFRKKKKYPFQRTKKGDPFQEESPIPNNSKSFLETWILLSPRKDHGRNSKVLPCPWPWLKRVTVHFYSRWPVRHVIRYKGSATKRGRQAL